jgi:hypothetical protein
VASAIVTSCGDEVYVPGAGVNVGVAAGGRLIVYNAVPTALWL